MALAEEAQGMGDLGGLSFIGGGLFVTTITVHVGRVPRGCPGARGQERDGARTIELDNGPVRVEVAS